MSKTFMKTLVWRAGPALAATAVALGVVGFITGRPTKHVTYRAAAFTSALYLTGTPLLMSADISSNGLEIASRRRASINIVAAGRWWVLCNTVAVNERISVRSEDGGLTGVPYGELGRLLSIARPVPLMLEDDTLRLLGEDDDLNSPWLYVSGEKALQYELSGQFQQLHVNNSGFISTSAEPRDSLSLAMFATSEDSGALYITVHGFSASAGVAAQVCPGAQDITLASTGETARVVFGAPGLPAPYERHAHRSFRLHPDSVALENIRRLSVGYVRIAEMEDATGAKLTLGVEERELSSELPLMIRSRSGTGDFSYSEGERVAYIVKANSVLLAGEELIAARWQRVPEWLAAAILTALVGAAGYLIRYYLKPVNSQTHSG